MSINKTILQGRLTRDPELRQTPGGKMVCTFTVAWSEKVKDTESKVFLNCVTWEKNAEFVAKHFQKGQELIVDGRLVARKWTDKEGNERETIELSVDRAHFCGPKKDNDQPVSHGGYSGGFRPMIDANDEGLPW